ncbi:uncharacterized protein LOC144124315 [Amblyomma americanum]
MGMLSFLLVIALAVTATGIIPVAPSINQQVDRVFPGGGLCEVLYCKGDEQKVREFYMWNDAWWFWPEFYRGHISGLRDGFRRFGDCAYQIGNGNVATCNVSFSGLGLHYRWRVGIKDFNFEPGQQRQKPLTVIEAGTMNATVAAGMIRLYLERDPGDRYFRAKMAETALIDIWHVVFSNPTIVWNHHLVHTNAVEFQRRLREMLAFSVEYYIKYKTFLDGFNEAFEDAQYYIAT